jgi:deoxyadenosine/deoxycytidine kinase
MRHRLIQAPRSLTVPEAVKKYVVLAGNIGSGKTTLVRMMCERLGWKPYFEPVTENPYLEDFYRDMARWAFHSQVFFLTHRVRSHHDLMDDPWSVVQDRSLYEDAEVFARNLYIHGRMSERDWGTYRELYRTVITLLPPPNLVVYLRASVPTLKRRIAQRGRGFEANISEEYLGELNTLYEKWIGGFDLAPVLVLPSDRMDFVGRPRDFELIVSEVEERLSDRQGLLF